MGPKPEGSERNGFSPKYFNQDRDKDSHLHLEGTFVKSLLTCSFPGRNSDSGSCTREHPTF